MNKKFFNFDFFNITQFNTVDSDRYQISSDLEFVHLRISLKNGTTILNHTISTIPQTIFLHVQPGTRVTLLINDRAGALSLSKILTTYHIIVEQNANVTSLIGLMHSLHVGLDLHFYLQGTHGQAQAFGIYALNDQQQVEIKTYQMHHASYTQSQVELKGMLKGQAQANVQGLIYIDQAAYKSDASQENKNIVCGQQARVVSIPSIEVLQHDVQCSHGSAVGQFDQKHLWYLQSRGLTSHQAYQLLIASFFGPVVEKFEKGELFMETLCQKMI